MAVKESSDELNPPVLVSANQIASRRRRTAGDYVALAIATCGVGYMPIAPGTWGSLVGVGLYMLLRLNLFHPPTDTDPLTFVRRFVAVEIIGVGFVTLIGIWAASRAERVLQIKDPGKVVIDEVAGQLIALMAVPLTVIGPWPIWVVLAFFLFRFFDIVKPYPIRRLEALESGLGIVIDDLAAGAYAAAVVSILIAVFALFT